VSAPAGDPGARRLLDALGVATTIGSALPGRHPPRSAGPGRLVVANHVGFLDVLVLAAWRPFVFVAKREVARWPVLGPRLAARGTLFIDRRPVRALLATVCEIAATLRAGRDVLLFAEGTTTVGDDVLPFRPAGFEAARQAGAEVECLALHYRVIGGRDPRPLVSWVGDDWLLPRVAALALAPPVTAIVEPVGVLPSTVFSGRKALAAAAQARIAHTVRAVARGRAPATAPSRTGHGSPIISTP
jgi:1-acyl-sn-glycerol-3-phosphate acyltransferase